MLRKPLSSEPDPHLPRAGLTGGPVLEVVYDADSHDAMLRAPLGIATVHFAWSGPSFAFRSLLADLAQTWSLWEPGRAVRFFSLEPDGLHPNGSPEVQAWLADRSRERGRDLANGGSGAALWLRAGAIVGFRPGYEADSVGALVSASRTFLGSALG